MTLFFFSISHGILHISSAFKHQAPQAGAAGYKRHMPLLSGGMVQGDEVDGAAARGCGAGQTVTCPRLVDISAAAGAALVTKLR